MAAVQNVYRDQPLLVGFDKVNEPIKILGVHFNYDLKKKQELSYDETEIAF